MLRFAALLLVAVAVVLAAAAAPSAAAAATGGDQQVYRMPLRASPFAGRGLEDERNRAAVEEHERFFGKNATLWFDEQLVDHSDPTNAATWHQRYVVFDDYFVSGGPIFLFLSGEAPLEFFWFQEQQALLWAKQFSALYVVLEHRFYGESFPTADTSTASLRFLTSQQALADAAYFLSWLRASNASYSVSPTQPAVSFGCSYSGALSAWFRAKYPNSVVAAVAPSGPVQAYTNFTQYLGQFSQSATPACVKAAAQATQQVQQLLAGGTAGLQQLQQTFKACKPLVGASAQDLFYFQYTLALSLGGADQMSNPPTWTLNQTCNSLVAAGPSGYLQAWADLVLSGYYAGQQCVDYSFADMIASLQNTSVGPQSSGRAWMWQTCVEFGWYEATAPGTSVFFDSLDAAQILSWCADVFGIAGMAPDVDWTNTYYGGYALDATNVAFTNGLLDPWHIPSITESSPSGGVLAFTYEAGHCGTMIAASSVDPPSLVQARQSVTAFLESVLPQ